MSGRVSDTFPDAGTHASRPADPGIVPAFYSCTDHDTVYRWNGSTWVDWVVVADTPELLLLEAGQDATDVPGGTAVGTIVFVKGS